MATSENQVLLKRLLHSPFYEEDNRATDKQIEDAQNTLGKKFPSGYVDWLKSQNGGLFDFHYSYQVPFQGDERVSLYHLIGVGEDGVDGVDRGQTRNERIISAWGFPDNSLVVIGNNHGGIAVTYDGDEPSEVINVESETATPYTRVLAPDFEHFIGYLQDFVNENPQPLSEWD